MVGLVTLAFRALKLVKRATHMNQREGMTRVPELERTLPAAGQLFKEEA